MQKQRQKNQLDETRLSLLLGRFSEFRLSGCETPISNLIQTILHQTSSNHHPARTVPVLYLVFLAYGQEPGDFSGLSFAQLQFELSQLVTALDPATTIEFSPRLFDLLEVFGLILRYCKQFNVKFKFASADDEKMARYLFFGHSLYSDVDLNRKHVLARLCLAKLLSTEYFDQLCKCRMGQLLNYLYTVPINYRLDVGTMKKFEGKFYVLCDYQFVNRIQQFSLEAGSKYALKLEKLFTLLRDTRFYYSRQQYLLYITQQRYWIANQVFFDMLNSKKLHDVQIDQLILDTANIEDRGGQIRFDLFPNQSECDADGYFAIRTEVLCKPLISSHFVRPVVRMLSYFDFMIQSQPAQFDTQVVDLLKRKNQIEPDDVSALLCYYQNLMSTDACIDDKIQFCIGDNYSSLLPTARFWIQLLFPSMRAAAVFDQAKQVFELYPADKMKFTCVDQISLRPLTSPARLFGCSHVQCLEYQSMIVTNCCAICKYPSSFDDVYVDLYLQSLINVQEITMSSCEISLNSGKILQTWQDQKDDDSDWEQ